MSMKISNRHLNFNLVKTALYFLYFQNHVLPQIFTFPQLESTGGQAKNTFFFLILFIFLLTLYIPRLGMLREKVSIIPHISHHIISTFINTTLSKVFSISCLDY